VRFLGIAVGAVVALIVILYAFGLRLVRVDEEPEWPGQSEPEK
jgi:uncharacterized membrane protein YgaE (UPF0421/DUF939 family)